MALSIHTNHASSDTSDAIFNFRHLPPGPDLRKDPRKGSGPAELYGAHNANVVRRNLAQQPLKNSPFMVNYYHSRRRRQRQQRFALDEEDGRELAASEVPLPSYAGAAARGLKRQEAFVGEGTSKRRMVQHGRSLAASDAELINLGILYNDEHLRGPGVTLDTIVHDEAPAYVVRHVRPRQHRRTARNAGVATATKFPELPLDLSFNRLGQDAAIAAFLSGSYLGFDEHMSAMLMGPDEAELEDNNISGAAGEDMEVERTEDDSTPRQGDFCFPAAPQMAASQRKRGAKSAGASFAHLEVIYEAEDPQSVEADMTEEENDEDGPCDTQIPDSDDLCYDDWASVSGLSMGSSQVELDFESDQAPARMAGGGGVACGGLDRAMSAQKKIDAWVVLAGGVS